MIFREFIATVKPYLAGCLQECLHTSATCDQFWNTISTFQISAAVPLEESQPFKISLR